MVSLLILLQLSLVFALENGGLIGRPFEYNICGTHAGRRVYLEQGSSGLIQAPEVVFKNVIHFRIRDKMKLNEMVFTVAGIVPES